MLATLPLALAFLSVIQDPARSQQSTAPSFETPQHRATFTAAAPDLAALLNDPELVLFDEPVVGGALWALGSNFKASFDAAGWSFYPKPLPGAPDLEPITFHLASVRVGGVDLTAVDGKPRRDDRRIVFAHGDVVQTIDVDGRGVEQGFVFERLPQRGEIVVDLAVSTVLHGEETSEGLAFRSAFARVTYARAIAIDAHGERIAAETRLVDGHIVIRVPASFVARAALPIVIDPRVASAVMAPGGGDLAEPDVACLAEIEGPFNPYLVTTWCVVFSRYFGANDWDCHAQVFDANLGMIGGLVPIDVTTDGWQMPRIASIRALWNNFLVVAQVRSGTAPKRVMGRGLSDPRGTQYLYPQLVIASNVVDCLNPDVCGDATFPTFRRAYYTVVWEQAFSPTDHDIHARQIEADFTLRFASPFTVQASTANQTNPSISKSCGQGNGLGTDTTQRIAMVWQDQWSGIYQDIHGCMLTWDGVFVPAGLGGHVFVIDGSAGFDVRPQVSSPTEYRSGRRLLLAVYERQGLNNGDIWGTCFDHLGNILATGNITSLENDPTRLSWPQYRPSVDTDGIRFGVAYHELYQNNPTVNDLDTRMSLVASAGNRLLVEEPGAILSFSGNREINVQVASQYSGGDTLSVGPSHSPRYCTANDRDNTNGTFAIDARTFDAAPQPSFITRSTACGWATLAVQGATTIGSTVTFTVSAGMPLQGFLVGAPVNQPIGACPGCTAGVAGTALIGGTWSLSIPFDPIWIGLPLAVQGFGFDTFGGPCLGQLHFTDTIDCTVL